MEKLYDLRRDRLHDYMVKKCGGQRTKLAEAIGRSESYVSRIFGKNNRKKLAEDLAREIEEKIGKPYYWLDGIETEASWPFPNINITRITSLPKDQKRSIEKSFMAVLEAVEGAAPKSGEDAA